MTEQSAPSTSSKISRRTFLKMSIGTILTTTISASIYSGWVEPNWIEVTKIPLSFPQLPPVFNKIRLVQFSDLHIKEDDDLSLLHSTIQEINSLEPDIICFTGDLFDQSFTDELSLKVSNQLSTLHAPYGKFTILGNHDYFYQVDKVKQCWKQSGFTLLINQSHSIQKENATLLISGLDDTLNGQPDFSILSNVPKKNFFHLLLAHEPDLADYASTFPVHLQLSGHSHGGQVQLPGIGPILTPPYSDRYPLGLYEQVDYTDLKLYTNRGLGTTLLPIRFFSRPEITLFTLTN